MALLGNSSPANVIVNELTTVASAFTAARFINGEAISGNPLGLRIAAGNAPNFVDPVNGRMGQSAPRPSQQLNDHDAGQPGHAWLADHGVVHGGQRRLARPFLQGRYSDGRRNAEEYVRSDGWHCPRAWAARRTFTRCSTKPIRCRHPMGGEVRPSYRISSTFPTTSPFRLLSRAAGCFTVAGLCLTPTATSGADRTGWRARSPASTRAPVAVWQVKPQRGRAFPADHRLHRHGH